jgi:hypothetical protein
MGRQNGIVTLLHEKYPRSHFFYVVAAEGRQNVILSINNEKQTNQNSATKLNKNIVRSVALSRCRHFSLVKSK